MKKVISSAEGKKKSKVWRLDITYYTYHCIIIVSIADNNDNVWNYPYPNYFEVIVWWKAKLHLHESNELSTMTVMPWKLLWKNLFYKFKIKNLEQIYQTCSHYNDNIYKKKREREGERKRLKKKKRKWNIFWLFVLSSNSMKLIEENDKSIMHIIYYYHHSLLSIALKQELIEELIIPI